MTDKAPSLPPFDEWLRREHPEVPWIALASFRTFIAEYVALSAQEAPAAPSIGDMTREAIVGMTAVPKNGGAVFTETPASENDEQVEHMVRRFLQWRLPENFNPDGGISFKRTFNENTSHPMKHEPVGTNLFDYTQAKEMVRYMLEGLPAEPSRPQIEGYGIMCEKHKWQEGNIDLAQKCPQCVIDEVRTKRDGEPPSLRDSRVILAGMCAVHGRLDCDKCAEPPAHPPYTMCDCKSIDAHKLKRMAAPQAEPAQAECAGRCEIHCEAAPAFPSVSRWPEPDPRDGIQNLADAFMRKRGLHLDSEPLSIAKATCYMAMFAKERLSAAPDLDKIAERQVAHVFKSLAWNEPDFSDKGNDATQWREAFKRILEEELRGGK